MPVYGKGTRKSEDGKGGIACNDHRGIYTKEIPLANKFYRLKQSVKFVWCQSGLACWNCQNTNTSCFCFMIFSQMLATAWY